MLSPIDFIAGLAKALLKVLAGLCVVFDEEDMHGAGRLVQRGLKSNQVVGACRLHFCHRMRVMSNCGSEFIREEAAEIGINSSFEIQCSRINPLPPAME
jgi:hypothetical protein